MGHSFADTVLALTEIAPTHPPRLVSHGLEIAHSLRRTVGVRQTDQSVWEELLALRRGPGADAFVLSPVPEERRVSNDPILDRAVEIRALVDALRQHRDRHAGQPLDRVLQRDALKTRRVALEDSAVPVVLRLGACFVIVRVEDEHPRVLRERIIASFREGPRELGRVRARRVNAPLLVSLVPVSFQEAVHLHRSGVEGPWLSWSHAAGSPPMSVLAAHHLVIDGPAFASLRADLGRRVRAFRVALGLDGADPGPDRSLDYSEFDAAPFDPYGWLPGFGLDPSFGSEDPTAEQADPGVARPVRAEADSPRHHGRGSQGSDLSIELPPGLPDDLASLLRGRGNVRSWAGPATLRGRPFEAPSVRFATLQRGAFSLPEFAYAYCRAQHDAMLRHDPHYQGQGFTFVVPHVPRVDAGGYDLGPRARPVLCSLHTRRGLPESLVSFRRRLLQRIDEADRGEDLLSRVLHDVLRLPLPGLLRSALVRLFERAPRDGGTFLGGRGLFAYTAVPDELVDPIAGHAGIYDGLFSGSCHERGGVSLTVIDRGSRRDLCAVGTGLFRPDPALDFFWERFAGLLTDG